MNNYYEYAFSVSPTSVEELRYKGFSIVGSFGPAHMRPWGWHNLLSSYTKDAPYQT